MRAFVDGLDDGPRALLFESEAGIGKTAVWRAALAEAEAAGCRVLRCVAEQAEVRLSFVGLGDLAGGLVDELLPALPGPQREALEVALVRRTSGSGRAPDPTAVGVGFRAARPGRAGGPGRGRGRRRAVARRGDGASAGVRRAPCRWPPHGSARDDADAAGHRGPRSGAQVLVAGLPVLTTISNSEGANDTQRLNTLGGNDRVSIDPGAELLITPVVDLGAGE